MLPASQAQWLEPLVFVFVKTAPHVVERYNFGQRRHQTVVHIRGCVFQLAQCRRIELADIAAICRMTNDLGTNIAAHVHVVFNTHKACESRICHMTHRIAPDFGIFRNAGVIGLIICQTRTVVALDTTGLALEQSLTTGCRFGHGAGIERCIFRNQRFQILWNCLANRTV